MRDQVIHHFQNADPKLYQTIRNLNLETLELEPETDHFVSLISSVVNQQLSEKAGSTIWGRFAALACGKNITADFVDKLTIEQIRRVGVSTAKATYIKEIASAALHGVFDDITNLSDTEVYNALTSIKGVGPWTAEMFLMFSLGREDVFSPGDVGLQNAIVKLYNLRQKPNKAKLQTLSNTWKPYRTYACRVLWRYLDMPL